MHLDERSFRSMFFKISQFVGGAPQKAVHDGTRGTGSTDSSIWRFSSLLAQFPEIVAKRARPARSRGKKTHMGKPVQPVPSVPA
jgi:hypothetical protein